MSEACITLTGLEATGFHGVFEHERMQGQRFVVDLRLWGAFDCDADDLEKTLDYSKISGLVVAQIESDPVNLIETLAGRIANAVLMEPLVTAAEVTVHKPEAPLPEKFGDVAVTLTRRKP